MMKKIIYFCLISILALNFNCSKDDFFAEEESKIDKNTESNEKFAKETITQKRKSSNRSPKVTSSNVILIRFSPSASANQIHNITNSIAPTSAIQCPNGDQIWVLSHQIDPEGRTIGQNGNGENDDDVEIHGIPEIVYFELDGMCSGGGSPF